MRLDLFSLHLFADVVDTRSINQGAKRNNISVSAASKRIADLEYLFGTQLLHRHARGVLPTDAGETLHARIQQTLGDLQQLMVEMSEFATGVRGQVRVFSNLTAMIHCLPGDLAAFVSEHRTVQVDLEEHSTSTTLESLLKGTADVGIVAPVVTYPEELNYWHYETVKHVVIVHPTHPLARREVVTFPETLAYDYIGLEAGGGWDVHLTQMARACGGRVKVRVRVSGFEAACRMVEANLGLAIVPSLTARVYARPLGLYAVPLNEVWASVPLHVCCRDLKSLPVSARLMVKHLTAGKPDGPPHVMRWWEAHSRPSRVPAPA
ncbi:MAG TPA: LysR family transcriptional regulator [Burkholderiaceae bacterium]|nr:LysR family transcriptional regulator [Burkholderiaceae bacterium]